MVEGIIPLSFLGLLMGRWEELVEPRSALCFGFCGWCRTLLHFAAAADGDTRCFVLQLLRMVARWRKEYGFSEGKTPHPTMMPILL